MGPFNPFRFDGVIGRLQYAGYNATWLALLAVSGVATLAGISASGDITATVLAFLVLLPLASLARLSYAIRRLRHIGWHPAWSVLALVPMAALGLDLALLAVPGAPSAPGPAGGRREALRGAGVHGRSASRWTDSGWVEVPAGDDAPDDRDQT